MTVFYFVSLYKKLQTLRKKSVLDFFFFLLVLNLIQA